MFIVFFFFIVSDISDMRVYGDKTSNIFESVKLDNINGYFCLVACFFIKL